MKSKSEQFDRVLLILFFCCGGFHTLISLFQYFFDLSVLRYVGYTLGAVLAVAAMTRRLLIGKLVHRLCLEQKLLIGMLI